jgi:serine/threonine protein kinase/tetratricopeptide (TPR) repeat protein
MGPVDMPTSGSRFGRYEIRERLGAGGMGEVYRARDTELPRDVAIKFLSDPFVTDPARLARFATEARAASALNHPNILTVHDVGESAGQPFIVMECVEGRTLREVIGRTPMAPRELLDIGVQIADGLAKAHGIGVVHRDLKPENVMVTEDGLVKIVDFGLAKPAVFDVGTGGTNVETHAGSPTVHGAILGTVGYMAPEQARGEAVDHRADQFALGAILYEMATGRRAFDCPSSVETLAATLDREPESVAALNPTLPAQARWLIERCLSKKPKQRYASTEDLAHELRTIREHLGEPWPSAGRLPAGLPVPVPVPPRPGVRRLAISTRAMLMAALVLVAAVLASPLRQPLWRLVAGPSWPAERRIVVLPINTVSDVGAVADGLLEYVAGRLSELNTYDRNITVVSTAEVIRAGVTTPSAARKKLAATIAVTITLAGPASDIHVSFEVADTERLAILAGGPIEQPGPTLSREVVVSRVIKALKVQLRPQQQALWQAGLTANVQAESLYAQGLRPFDQGKAALQQYEQKERLEEAIGYFLQAVDSDRLYAAAWAGLGEAYLRLYRLTQSPEHLSEAEKALQRALDLHDDRPSIWISVGMLHVAKGEAAEAERAFQRVIAVNPAGADAYRELGEAYRQAKQLDKAEPQFRRALELEPHAWTNHSHMGVLRLYQGRFDEAESEFKAGLALAPENARLWSNLGGLYMLMNREADAERALKTAVDTNPTLADAVSNLGVFYFKRGRYAEAVATFERAAGLSPGDAEIWRNLAVAQYSATGDRQRSVAAYQKAASLLEQRHAINRTDARVLVNLAVCYAALGRPVDARALVSEALKGQLKEDELAAGVSVYEDIGDRAAALEVIRGALAAGQPASIFEDNRSLDRLRQDPRYAAIVKTAEEKKKPSGR